MISSFKKRITDFIDRRVNKIRKQQRSNQQVLLDYNQINQLFPESCFIPFTTWSISPSTILHVLNDISINQRKHIIEFGSGASTIYIARLIKTLGLKTKFYSVESDGEWLHRMKSDIDRFKLQDVVTFIHAPLSKVPQEYAFTGQELWYDTDAINRIIVENTKIDLILVDGPIGGSTPYARFSAVPFLHSRLSADASIFLDDAHRNREQQIAQAWSQLLGVRINSKERYVFFLLNEDFEIMPFKMS